MANILLSVPLFFFKHFQLSHVWCLSHNKVCGGKEAGLHGQYSGSWTVKGDKEMEAMPGTKRKAVPEMLGGMAPTHRKSRDTASSERGTKDKKDLWNSCWNSACLPCHGSWRIYTWGGSRYQDWQRWGNGPDELVSKMLSTYSTVTMCQIIKGGASDIHSSAYFPP